MQRLREKRILIAGGTGNVGWHLVEAHLAEGATVVVPSRSRAKLDLLERGIDAVSRQRLIGIVGDMTDERQAREILRTAGPLDGAVASLGDFVPAPSILGAGTGDLRRTLDGYVMAHFAVARAVVPHLAQRGGGYVLINGPLAFEPLHPGTGLVSIATAAQAMLARLLMKETAGSRVRVSEVVLYSGFGWNDDEGDETAGAEIGGFVAGLLADEG